MRDQLGLWGGPCFEMSERTMSDEFDSLDPKEKAATEAALKRCHALAGQIESELHNKKPEHFIDKLSLADFYASLERAAWVLEQKSTPKGKGSRERSRQRHR
jgi:hypothetical protein